jgi:hypothetical protein
MNGELGKGVMHEHTPNTPQDELLTVADLALILQCKESSVYNLTRRRGRARYDNPVPVLRLPCGLRFKRSSILAWLDSLETTRQERRSGRHGIDWS